MISDTISRFPVGKLSKFEKLGHFQIIDALAEMQCFKQVSTDYLTKLKDNFNIFVSRLDAAIGSTGNDLWIKLCDEPKKKLRGIWKLDKSSTLSEEEQRQFTIKKNQSHSMYYCLYVILLWRHPLGLRRFESGISSMEAFREEFERDEAFEKRCLECGQKPDSWSVLFDYRNVLILAAAIKPTQRNKGTFAKVSCILSEGRVHPFGGGQSYAADRRGYLYEKVGLMFTPHFASGATIDHAIVHIDRFHGSTRRKSSGDPRRKGRKLTLSARSDEVSGESDYEVELESELVEKEASVERSEFQNGGMSKRLSCAGASASSPRVKRKCNKRSRAPTGSAVSFDPDANSTQGMSELVLQEAPLDSQFDFRWDNDDNSACLSTSGDADDYHTGSELAGPLMSSGLVEPALRGENHQEFQLLDDFGVELREMFKGNVDSTEETDVTAPGHGNDAALQLTFSVFN